MKKLFSKIIISIFISVILTTFIAFGINMDNKILDLTPFIKNDMNTIEVQNNKYITKSNDSWFKINDIKNSDEYNYILVNIDSLNKETLLTVYYTDKEIFSEDKKIEINLSNGINKITLNNKNNFENLRFDIGSEEGIEFTIDSLNLVSEVSNSKFVLISFVLIYLMIFIILKLGY